MTDRNKNNQTLLQRIDNADGKLLPVLTNMEFVRFVHASHSIDDIWHVYISHDPCHDIDSDGYRDDRNTVIAFHENCGIFRIIGRELPHELAMKIALGEY